MKSCGEYIQFLDSDDIFYSEMLHKIVDVFKQECDVVHVGYEKLCAACRRPFYRYIPVEMDSPLAAYMAGKLFGHTMSFMRRRSLCRDIGPWDESLPIDQDGDYMCRTILRNVNIGIVPDILYAYMVRAGEKINDKKDSHAAWLARLQRETQFCRGIAEKTELSLETKGSYAADLYKNAVHLCGGSFQDIGDSFGKLADSISDVVLDGHGKRMRTIWKSGHQMCKTYVWARRMKQWRKSLLLKKVDSASPPCRLCGR
jgi:hypothetical protein